MKITKHISYSVPIPAAVAEEAAKPGMTLVTVGGMPMAVPEAITGWMDKHAEAISAALDNGTLFAHDDDTCI